MPIEIIYHLLYAHCSKLNICTHIYMYNYTCKLMCLRNLWKISNYYFNVYGETNMPVLNTDLMLVSGCLKIITWSNWKVASKQTQLLWTT